LRQKDAKKRTKEACRDRLKREICRAKERKVRNLKPIVVEMDKICGWSQHNQSQSSYLGWLKTEASSFVLKDASTNCIMSDDTLAAIKEIEEDKKVSQLETFGSLEDLLTSLSDD